MICITLLILVAAITALVIYWAREVNQEWKRRGVKHRKPVLFIGNMISGFKGQKHFSIIYEEVCKEFPDEPIVGFYGMTKAWLMVKDADYIEKILIKDFTHFMDHGFEVNQGKNPIDAQLFMMSGKRWRALRNKISPIFTSGRLKGMFESMIECGDDLEQYLKKSNRKEIDFRTVMTRHVIDVVGSSVFGICPKALQNPNSEYCRLASNIFAFGFWGSMKMMVMAFFPGVSKILGLSFNNPKAVDYFCKILKDTFEYRKLNNVQRNDFIQLLMSLKEKKKIEIKNLDQSDGFLKGNEDPKDYESYELSDNVLMAQAYAFLVNGVDGVSMAETYVFLELALHTEIQEKVRKEIQEQMALHEGLSYDAIKNMTYLEKVIKETLRIHPGSSDLLRVCTKQYTFPNGLSVKEGDSLKIPITVIHKNPNYFPDPECFKPERFDVPMKPGTYLAFGDGPRVCIAIRYATVLIKLSVAKVLINFKVKLNPKTKLPVELNPTAIVNTPLHPLLFDLVENN